MSTTTTVKECVKCLAEGYAIIGPTARTHCAYCNTELVEVRDSQ